MDKMKKVLRVLVLAFILILAFFGLGFLYNPLNGNRERYQNRDIRIEQNDRRNNEQELEEEDRI